MESAPLTLAHTHARNASLEIQRSNPVAASEEHDLAAVEFAAAAQGTNDAEARRILNLLEQHHKKLGQLLKSTHQRPLLDAEEKHPGLPQEKELPGDHIPSATAKAPSPAERTLSTNVQLPPRLSRNPTPTGRELANSLASARGIPASRPRKNELALPAVSTQHAGGQFATEDGRRQGSERRQLNRQGSASQAHRPSWAPPTSSPLKETFDEATDTAGPADAPFQQFYNTFETLITKFSAPLAFAGFPLTTTSKEPDTLKAPNSPKSKPVRESRATARVDSSMDYSSLISPAALRAVRDGIPSNPSESFYVVPTTGGTLSYADIMSRAERETRQASRDHVREPSGLSEDDFYDARTTVPSVESLDRQTAGSVRRTATLSADTKTVNGKTMEELSLENQALKHLADKLSKRLHVFELSSQSSSAALAQSIRSLQRSPLTTPENSGRGGSARGASDDKTKARIAELEEILKKTDRENQRRRDDNTKLRETLRTYRARWDKLKEGAKARREGTNASTKPDTIKEAEEAEVELGPPVEPEQETGISAVEPIEQE